MLKVLQNMEKAKKSDQLERTMARTSWCRCFLSLCLVLFAACTSPTIPEEAAQRNYLIETYYTTYAKERGDVILELTDVMKTFEPKTLSSSMKQGEMVRLIEKWSKTRKDSREKTAKDDSVPWVKPIRDKYIEAEDILTVAYAEAFMALDPDVETGAHRDHVKEMVKAYQAGMKALEEAHALLEKELLDPS